MCHFATSTISAAPHLPQRLSAASTSALANQTMIEPLAHPAQCACGPCEEAATAGAGRVWQVATALTVDAVMLMTSLLIGFTKAVT
jgi:hypothetical protein